MTHSCRPQANYKILAARIQNDIYLLTMRLRHTTLRAEFEQTVSALTGVEGAGTARSARVGYCTGDEIFCFADDWKPSNGPAAYANGFSR